jgi:phosphate transport system substrate-binding protein
MAYTRGRCSNFDYCSIADSRRDVEVRVGDDFVCPECGKPLKAPPVGAGSGSNLLLPGLIGVGVLVLVGGAVFLGMRMGASRPPAPPQQVAQTTAPVAVPPPAQPAALPPAAPQAAAPTPGAKLPATPAPAQSAATAPAPAQSAPTAPPVVTENVLVRLAGSPAIGAALAPKLAAAYLAQIGDTDVKSEPGDAPTQTKVVGLRGDRQEAIVIDSSSADAGFKDLTGHAADVVMADRRILPAERDALVSQGDMTSPAAEHVLGLNALSVVVNPVNALASLTRDQIKGIFTGAIKDWSGVGLGAGPIDLYGPPANSPAASTLSALALGGADLPPTAKRLADGKQIAAAIASDPHGVGIIAAADIGAARPVPVADTGSSPVLATNHAAVASDDYPLAYRLYLYTPAGGAGGIAQRFVDFAVSPAGQALVEQAGFVSQTLKPESAATPETTTGKFKAYVAGAKHLAIAFHFQPNSTDLDQKGTRDLDRVMNYILSNHYTPDHLILIGFADNQGDPATNIAVSKKRADAVAALFTARGLPPGKVAGFGAELPIADNSTEEGREKNRRVEVFIAP